MARRKPTKADRERVITIDLLADWRPYADPLPLPHDDFDWRYHGAVVRGSAVFALAWRSGNYGFGAGKTVTPCELWDRIKINHILMFENPPGFEGIPQFAASTSWQVPDSN